MDYRRNHRAVPGLERRTGSAYPRRMRFSAIPAMLATLGGVALLFTGVWTRRLLRDPEGLAPPRPATVAVGAVAMFFDTLGIGSFATTTAAFRAFRLVPDQLIPGTLNAGHSLASILQAFLYTAIIPVDAATLVLLVAAATLGAWLGAGVVSGWPRRRIQAGMGVALLAAAGLMLPRLLGLVPAGGEAAGLAGGKLALATAGNFLLGALMTLGVGLFAPCMIMLSLLGMGTREIFPIMMSACAFLMPVGGLRFIRARAYAPAAALALTLGGLPAVLVATYLVKELPLGVLRWLVLGVVVVTGITLLAAARKPQPD